MKTNKIGVIGGGIIGFSTANIVQERYPNVEIELTSDKIFNSTTSWGAPGFVRLNVNELRYEDTFRWYAKGIDHYWKLFRSPDCEKTGVLINNFYYLSDKKLDLPANYKDLYHGFREVNSKELAAIGFSSNIKFGVSFLSTIIESRYYLKYMADKFRENGGKIINGTIALGKQNVANWALENNYDLVFNCAGLGSRKLFNDDEVVPLRGQLVRVEAPWFKYSFATTDDTYAYSCKESVVLGGFRQQNDYDLSVRPQETRNILERIKEHNICLGESRIIEEWTGLRPFRKQLRLEIEYVESSSGLKIPVIHNYGHGSSGIGLSWGTSLEAVDLINNIAPNFIRANM